MMRYFKRDSIRKFCLLIILIIPHVSIHAHPHVFIDNRTVYIFDEKGLRGLKVEWTFDDMFGSSIVLDYDIDGDHTFNQTEIDTIYAEAFSNLENYGYLYHIKINGKQYNISGIDSFSAEYREEKLIYSFFIPCRIETEATSSEVVFAVYDDTYFIDVTTDMEKGVSIHGHKNIESTIDVKDTTVKNEMYGDLRRRIVTIKFKKKYDLKQ